MSELERSAQLVAAQNQLQANKGGKTETQDKRERCCMLWEEAMMELHILEDRWYVLDPGAFESFSYWALVAIDQQDLDNFTAMLNHQHRRIFKNGDSPWAKQAEILEIKKSYEVSVDQQRKERDASLRERGIVPETKQKRVSYQDAYLQRVIEHRESLVGVDPEAWHVHATIRVKRHLALLAWILLSVLFAVQVSTLGAMEASSDVWVADGKLCILLRYVKWWIAGQQGNWWLPLLREKRFGIPFVADGLAFRDRAVQLIMITVWYDVLMYRTEQGWKGASSLFNSNLREFGWLTDSSSEKSTSHSRRKTCIAAASSLGAPMSVLREWMLVLQESTVDTYSKGEANFEARPVTRDLIGFLVDMV